MGDPAHDAHAGIQLAAVDREIDVHRVVVGGQQHRRSAADPGAFDRLPVRRVAGVDRVDDRRESRERRLVVIERIDDQSLLLQSPRGGLPDLAGANHQHRRRRTGTGDQGVERANLLGGARDDHHGIGAKLRVWKRGLQPAALPEPDDAEAGQLAQPRVAHERARQNGVADRQLRDLHTAERADHVRLDPAGVDAIGQRLAKLALQREHRGGAAQLQDVDRVVLFDDGGDVDLAARLRERSA